MLLPVTESRFLFFYFLVFAFFLCLIGMPRDSRENAVQICPICKFQATTKNPYRHLQVYV
jgi:hypothetical protein